MISPFELARLLDKQRNLKMRKDSLAPWYVGTISWVLGICWGKFHAPCAPAGGFSARFRCYRDAVLNAVSGTPADPGARRTLYHAVMTDAIVLTAIVIGFGLILGLIAVCKSRQQKSVRSRRFCFFVCALWALLSLNLGIIAGAPQQIRTPPENTPCAISATVSDIQPGTTQATIQIRQYRCDGMQPQQNTPFKARMSLSGDEARELRIGMRFNTTGEFIRYQTPGVPGTFNAASWAKNTGLSGFFKRDRQARNGDKTTPKSAKYEPPPHVALEITHAPQNQWYAWLNAKRRAAYTLLEAHSSAGMLPALILGTTRAVDDQTRDDFGRLGIAHVLAVSGMHFGIIAFLIVTVLRRIISFFPYVMRRWGRRRLSIILMMPILAVYLLFVGAPLSAQRALIMLAVCNLGQITGRKCDKMRAFLFAALVMSICDPNVIFAISFQLSFAAVLGIIWCTDFYAKFCKIRIQSIPLPKRVTGAIEAVFSALLVTVATAMTTAPFVLYHFGQLPVIGTLSNLIVIPWVSFVLMPVMIVAAFAILVHAPLGAYFTSFSQCLEDITVRFAGLASHHIPVACIDVMPNIALSLATAVVVCLIWIRPHNAKWRVCLAVIPAVCLTIATAALAIAPQKLTKPDGMRISFVDMGQADATLIEFPDGRNMLIDAGAELGRQSNATQTQLLPYLKRRGIKTIDILVLTHWDYDHVAGLPHLLDARAVNIKEIWHNGVVSPDPKMRQMLIESGIPLKNAQTMTRSHVYGGSGVQVLWPPRQFQSRSPETDRSSCSDASGAENNTPKYAYTRAGNVAYREARHCPNQENAQNTMQNDDLLADPNDTSIVLHIEWGHFSALFMGDASEAVERQILMNHPQLTANTTLLKAGHHGSKTSSSKPYVAHVNPRYAVFSVGRNNRYKFPHFDVQSAFFEQNTEMLRTDTHGTIQVLTNGRHMQISTMY